MMPREQIKETKILVGKFYEEMKSNLVTDFIIWLDCKLEYTKHCNEQMCKVNKPL